MSLLERPIQSVRFAVVDLETTGFDPEGDRVVEIAVRLFSPADESVLVFDSLVNPERPMRATQYHGIRHEDIQGAPTFRELALTLEGIVSAAVLTAYNVAYDARFLAAEFDRLGHSFRPPQLCLMWLMPLLGLGRKCSLPDACAALDIPFDGAHHVAADDAKAAHGLLKRYLKECSDLGVQTFGDLSARGTQPFFQTFHHELSPQQVRPLHEGLSRRDWPPERRTVPGADSVRTYFDALVGVLSDGQVTEDEETLLADLQHRLHLRAEQVRALHARAYLCIAMNCIGDDWLDATELGILKHVSRSLARLGWAPGC